jgi:hypothetical protein
MLLLCPLRPLYFFDKGGHWNTNQTAVYSAIFCSYLQQPVLAKPISICQLFSAFLIRRQVEEQCHICPALCTTYPFIIVRVENVTIVFTHIQVTIATNCRALSRYMNVDRRGANKLLFQHSLSIL